MDPIARINIRGDSTFALLLEAQKRGHGLSYCHAGPASLRRGAGTRCNCLTVRDERQSCHPRRAQAAPLNAFDVILLRQEPPFDIAYITRRICWNGSIQDAGRQRSGLRAHAPEKMSC